MPRRVKGIVSAKKRLQTDQYRRPRSGAGWLDPFPEMHGTIPEKMVYARLSQMGIPFLFLNDVNINIPDLDFNKDYQADFVFPDIKLIVEVQGAHWHSFEKNIEADAYKFALYEAVGYRALAWWDYDIYDHLNDLIFSEPQLLSLQHSNPTGKSSELPVVKRTKVDTSKGIRTLNKRRDLGTHTSLGRRSLRKSTGARAL